MRFTVLSAALLAVAPFAATAADLPLALGYETFEYAVPHIDLAECPAELREDGRFCRATMHSEEFHIFVFAEADDQPLVGYQAYPSERIGEILN